MSRRISDSTVRRLSHYLRVLELIQADGGVTVSSEELAKRGHTTAAQVRKDLSHFGSFGKRGLGYSVDELKDRLRTILGLDRLWRVILVGAGRIGSALFDYPDFKKRGYDCVAIVDTDPEKIGERWGERVIRPAEELESLIRELNVNLVILAVPASAAQVVAERSVNAGVKGILNFAPVQIQVPEGIPVENVNLVMELEALSFQINRASET
ncbi:MAG TPA: redox-sensing transcriptional repressor Rex [Gemmatimonadetes bacterium]|nr:redox-sensing transcriptional repressor Rex [Gemmatimonadota bacterium]HIB08395.1 redox-sensing transcriptional repressor Rex [Gemmatimonadota bacterium]HIN77265.1 redox-sensing transcriptional repressor Rex [Gemmatimonadota bacterium]